MKIITGNFNGNAAASYLCVGIKNIQKARFVNLEATNAVIAEWDAQMERTGEGYEGIYVVSASATINKCTYGTGIRRYDGGDILTSANTAYFIADPEPDKRTSTYGTINKWTLGSSTNRTGNFNLEADTTYVGEGSQICVNGQWATIYAMTSNGEQANEVTLNKALPSGEIQALTGMYSYINPATFPLTTPAGLLISNTTLLASGNIVNFEIGYY